MDVVISDLVLPGMDGMRLLMELKGRRPLIPFILLVAVREMSIVMEAVRLGALRVLVKPPNRGDLVDAVRAALNSKPAAQLAGLPLEFHGQSPCIIEVRERISLASKTDASLLIMGETGTGKELVTRAVHRLSKRGQKELITFNCAVAPPHLWESLFLGHRRGAFTGATVDSKGLLEIAHGSTLLLDELQSMPPDQQPKLLRVIEDGEVWPLGATARQKVSIRFITAINRKPEEMIAAGTLRDDLFYRLSGFEISLPALSEHLDDIPLLAAYFLRDSDATIAPEAMEALLSHGWPGNIRQLQMLLHAAAGAAAASSENTITLRHLAYVNRAFSLRPLLPQSGEFLVSGTMEQIGRQAITQALHRTRGNQSEAARLLGIEPKTLRRKLNKSRKLAREGLPNRE